MRHELRNMINSILAPGNKRQQNTNSQMLLFSHTVETLGSVTAVECKRGARAGGEAGTGWRTRAMAQSLRRKRATAP